MKLVIDGVFFSLADSGISRVWRSIIPHLLTYPELDITMLDRGGAPRIAGVKRLPFPSYKDLYNADDSILIQKACDHLEADVFTSTYYTTPLETPMFLIVHDMIPEIMGFDLQDRHWQEKAIALSYARKFVAVSNNTRSDLTSFYPHLASDTCVAHCAFDGDVFKPVDRARVAKFREDHALNRPYMLLVGSREQHGGYKNAALFFQALRTLDKPDFDIVCVGGEPTIDPQSLAMVPRGMTIQRVRLPDSEMAAAYTGAAALVYPSLYEGFGLPVLEAMACGCPVITTRKGSLGEVAGDAAITIDGRSVAEMVAALAAVREPAVGQKLRMAGLEQSSKFSWSKMASTIRKVVAETSSFNDDASYRKLVADWGTLRRMQSAVDVKTWTPPDREAQ